MAMNRTAWVDSVLDFGTTQLRALGTLREDPGAPSGSVGSRWYRYVLNGDAATTWAAGNVIQRKSATDSAGTGIQCATTDVYAGAVLGVAVSAIPAGSYGWVQIKGYNSAVVTDGSVASGDAVGSKGATTAGSVYTVTKGLGTDFAYSLKDDSGTQGFVILAID